MFKKIGVALDGSRCAEEAFKVALELAHAERAQLAICSVVDPIMIAGSSPLPSPATEIVIDDMERFAKELVARAIERARESGIVASGKTRCGAPAFEIVKYAEGLRRRRDRRGDPRPRRTPALPDGQRS